MLKPVPLANSFAATAAAFYIFLFLLKALAPPFFKLIFNSQFLGADIASQMPKLNLANFIGALIAVSIVSWAFGYLVAIFYNKSSKNQH